MGKMRRENLQLSVSDIILVLNPKLFPMKQEFDLRPIPASKLLFRLALLGIVLLGCVYGFLMLFNTALEAMK
jgi:hypothetical protein